MNQKRFVRALSVLISLIMLVSLINIPALSAGAEGLDGEPRIDAEGENEYVIPNSAAMDDFISNWYKVALGRSPKNDELETWKKELTGGITCGSRAAYGFLFSTEYRNKNKSNSAFVNDLYQLMLGRTPDSEGKANWVNQLKKGKSREQVFAGFANSVEYYKICKKLNITAGYWEAGFNPNQLNSVNMFVERLYKVCLGRIGDKDGQEDWVTRLIKGQITGAKCAYGFIFSDEYVKKKLSNEDYIKNLYIAIMGRTYDEAGYADWARKLRKGMSRDEVFAGFVNSTEFDNICKSYGIIRGDYTPTDIGNYDAVTYKVGDIIKFGKYEQDGNLSNGKEDIEWEVVSVEEDRILIITKYGIDDKPYNTKLEEVTWETCSLRKWLNDDFFYGSFTGSERKKIFKVTLENNDNPKYNSPGGNNTKDKIFILSLDEISKYYGYQWYSNNTLWGANQRLLCEPTPYAIQNGAYHSDITADYYKNFLRRFHYTSDVIGLQPGYWWVRTPGYSSNSALYVGSQGGTGLGYFYSVSGKDRVIRPAMFIEY